MRSTQNHSPSARLVGASDALEAVNWSQTDAAEKLHIPLSTLHQKIKRFSTHVAAILLEEGFNVNHHKTRIMRQGVRQRLAGLVANARINVTRTDFDRLKATLHNCVRLGAQTQNRMAHPRFRAHLDGRIGWVESVNPAKGQRLRAIFDRIAWR